MLDSIDDYQQAYDDYEKEQERKSVQQLTALSSPAVSQDVDTVSPEEITPSNPVSLSSIPITSDQPYFSKKEQEIITSGKTVPFSPVSPTGSQSMFSPEEQRAIMMGTSVNHPPTGEELSIPEEIGHGVMRGFIGIPKILAKATEFVGDVTGFDELKNRAANVSHEAERMMKEDWAASPSTQVPITEDKGQLINPNFWASVLSEQAPLLLGTFGVNMGAKLYAGIRYGGELAAARAAGNADKVAELTKLIGKTMESANLNTFRVMELAGAYERQQEYEKMTGQELSWPQKIITGLGAGALGGYVGGKVIHKIFGGAGGQEVVDGVLKTIGKDFGSMGAMMGALNLIQNAFQKYGYDPSKKMTEGVLDSIITGAVSGGVIGAGKAAYRGATGAYSKPPPPPEDKTKLDNQPLDTAGGATTEQGQGGQETPSPESAGSAAAPIEEKGPVPGVPPQRPEPPVGSGGGEISGAAEPTKTEQVSSVKPSYVSPDQHPIIESTGLSDLWKMDWNELYREELNRLKNLPVPERNPNDKRLLKRGKDGQLGQEGLLMEAYGDSIWRGLEEGKLTPEELMQRTDIPEKVYAMLALRDTKNADLYKSIADKTYKTPEVIQGETITQPPQETVITPNPNNRENFPFRDKIEQLYKEGKVEEARQAIDDYRKEIEQQAENKYNVDSTTGGKLRKAFDAELPKVEADPDREVSYMDLAGLGFANDKSGGGHPLGDLLLKTLGRILHAHNVDFYRIGGDEFATFSKVSENYADILSKVREAFRNETISLKLADGTILKTKGWTFEHGTGQTSEAADKALYDYRKRLVEAGERDPAKGARPLGLHTETSRGAADSEGVGRGAGTTGLTEKVSISDEIKSIREELFKLMDKQTSDPKGLTKPEQDRMIELSNRQDELVKLAKSEPDATQESVKEGATSPVEPTSEPTLPPTIPEAETPPVEAQNAVYTSQKFKKGEKAAVTKELSKLLEHPDEQGSKIEVIGKLFHNGTQEVEYRIRHTDPNGKVTELNRSLRDIKGIVDEVVPEPVVAGIPVPEATPPSEPTPPTENPVAAALGIKKSGLKNVPQLGPDNKEVYALLRNAEGYGETWKIKQRKEDASGQSYYVVQSGKEKRTVTRQELRDLAKTNEETPPVVEKTDIPKPSLTEGEIDPTKILPADLAQLTFEQYHEGVLKWAHRVYPMKGDFDAGRLKGMEDTHRSAVNLMLLDNRPVNPENLKRYEGKLLALKGKEKVPPGIPEKPVEASESTPKEVTPEVQPEEPKIVSSETPVGPDIADLLRNAKGYGEGWEVVEVKEDSKGDPYYKVASGNKSRFVTEKMLRDLAEAPKKTKKVPGVPEAKTKKAKSTGETESTTAETPNVPVAPKPITKLRKKVQPSVESKASDESILPEVRTADDVFNGVVTGTIPVDDLYKYRQTNNIAEVLSKLLVKKVITQEQLDKVMSDIGKDIKNAKTKSEKVPGVPSPAEPDIRFTEPIAGEINHHTALPTDIAKIPYGEYVDGVLKWMSRVYKTDTKLTEKLDNTLSTKHQNAVEMAIAEKKDVLPENVALYGKTEPAVKAKTVKANQKVEKLSNTVIVDGNEVDLRDKPLLKREFPPDLVAVDKIGRSESGEDIVWLNDGRVKRLSDYVKEKTDPAGYSEIMEAETPQERAGGMWNMLGNKAQAKVLDGIDWKSLWGKAKNPREALSNAIKSLKNANHLFAELDPDMQTRLARAVVEDRFAKRNDAAPFENMEKLRTVDPDKLEQVEKTYGLSEQEKQSESDIAFKGTELEGKSNDNIFKFLWNKFMGREKRGEELPQWVRDHQERVGEEYRPGEDSLDLVGRRVEKGREAESLTIMAQGYRNPAIESLGVVITHPETGVVLSNTVMTAGNISTVGTIRGAEFITKINGIADNLSKKIGQEVDIHVFHNHPSGNPEPSLGDMKVAENMRAGLPNEGINGLGDRMKTFLIINGKRYATLERVLNVDAKGNYSFGLEPKFGEYDSGRTSHDLTQVQNSQHLAGLVSQLKENKTHSMFVFMDDNNNLHGGGYVSIDIFDKSHRIFYEKVSDMMHEMDATQVAIIAGEDAQMAKIKKAVERSVEFGANTEAGHWLFDALDTKGLGLRETNPELFETKRSRHEAIMEKAGGSFQLMEDRESREQIKAFNEATFAKEEDSRGFVKKLYDFVTGKTPPADPNAPEKPKLMDRIKDLITDLRYEMISKDIYLEKLAEKVEKHPVPGVPTALQYPLKKMIEYAIAGARSTTGWAEQAFTGDLFLPEKIRNIYAKDTIVAREALAEEMAKPDANKSRISELEKKLAQKEAREFYGEKMVNAGPGLMQTLQPMRDIAKRMGADPTQVKDDLFSLMVVERNRELIGVTGNRARKIDKGIDPEMTEKTYQALEKVYGPEFENMKSQADDVRKFLQKAIIDNFVLHGVLDQEQADMIKAGNQFYVPFFRVMEEMDSKGYVAKNTNLYELTDDGINYIKGSERKILDPAHMIVNMLNMASDVTARARLGQMMNYVRLFSDVPGFELVPSRKFPVPYMLRQEVDPVLRKGIEDLMKNMNIEYSVKERLSGGALGRFIQKKNAMLGEVDAEASAGRIVSDEKNYIHEMFGASERTPTHELGHAIDHKYGEHVLQDLLLATPELRKEMRAIADQRTSGLESEAFKKYVRSAPEKVAEFVNRYINANEVARQTAPKAVEAFEAFLDQHPEIASLKTLRPSAQVSTREMQGKTWVNSPFRPDISAIQIRVDGKPFWIKVPAEIYKSFTAMPTEATSMVQKLMALPAQLTRSTAVTVPEFMAKNPLRDVVMAWLFGHHGFKVSGWVNDIYKRLTNDPMTVERLKEAEAGGAFFGDFARSMDEASKLKAEDLAGKGRGYIRYVKNPLEALQEVSAFFENVTRYSIYRQALDAGHSHAEAVYAARTTTLDFRRSGASRIAKVLGMQVPFFNATLQGVDKMMTELTGPNKGAVWAKIVGGIMAPSVLLALYNRDDKRIKQLEPWERNLFWHISLGENMPIIRYPKPFEIGILFGSLPERIVDYMYDNDLRGFKTGMKQGVDSLIPGLLPQWIKPFIEAASNYNLFTDRPIEDQGIKNLPPELRVKPWTSELAKAFSEHFGKNLGISPVMMEHFVRSYTGGVGSNYMLPAVDFAMKQAGLAPDIPKPEQDLIQQIPGVRALFSREPTGYRAKEANDFFDRYSKTTMSDLGWKAMWNQGDTEKAIEFLGDHPEALFARAYRQQMTEIGKIKKEQAKILRDPDIDSKEKREKMDALDEKVLGIATMTNAFMRDPVTETVKLPELNMVAVKSAKPVDEKVYYKFLSEPIMDAFDVVKKNWTSLSEMDDNARNEYIAQLVAKYQEEYKPRVAQTELQRIKKEATPSLDVLYGKPTRRQAAEVDSMLGGFLKVSPKIARQLGVNIGD